MKSMARFAGIRGGRPRLEELAPEVGEAARALAAAGQRDLVVAAVHVGNELAERVSEHAQRRVAGPAAREDVRDELLLSFVTRDEAPEPRRAFLALVLHALGGLVGLHDLLLGDELQQALRQRLGRLRDPAKQVAQRRVIHLYADTAVGLGLPVQRKRVGALRDDDLGHERRSEAGLVVDLGRRVCRDDCLAAAAPQLLPDVDLALDARGDEVVDLGHLPAAEPAEVVAAALRAGLLVLADLMLDPAGNEPALLLSVLSTLLQRGDPCCLRPSRVADLLRHRRHLLGALAELVPLQLLERRLDLRESGFERLRPVPPLAAMIVAAHWRR
jgi:hypothetical protein